MSVKRALLLTSLILAFSNIALASVGQGDATDIYKRGASAYESDPRAAFGFFQQAADEGHVGAMVGLATCLEKGHGTAVDYAKALEWFEKAARLNSLKGVEGLARIYASCPDPEFHDGLKAVKFASAVVRKKSMDPEALDLFAAAYLRDNQIENAVQAGRKAIKYADSLKGAKALKARMATYGEGQPIPAIATEEWIMRAAQKDIEWAVVKLIEMVGDPSVDMYTPQLAVLMCSKAVKMGRPEFYLNMGRIHFHEGRLEDAYESYRAAARNRAVFKEGFPVELRYYSYLKQPKDHVLRMAGKLKTGYSNQVSYMATVTKIGYDPYGGSYTYQEQERRTRTVKVPPDPAASCFLYEIAAKMDHVKALDSSYESRKI